MSTQSSQQTTWIVAFRNLRTHTIVGPTWIHEQEAKPVRWAERACYDGCEYAIMNGRGYEGRNIPDRVLQRQEWHTKPTTLYCEELGCEHISVNMCHFCGAVLCATHSHKAISDKGLDVFACPECNDTLPCEEV